MQSRDFTGCVLHRGAGLHMVCNSSPFTSGIRSSNKSRKRCILQSGTRLILQKLRVAVKLKDPRFAEELESNQLSSFRESRWSTVDWRLFDTKQVTKELWKISLGDLKDGPALCGLSLIWVTVSSCECSGPFSTIVNFKIHRLYRFKNIDESPILRVCIYIHLSYPHLLLAGTKSCKQLRENRQGVRHPPAAKLLEPPSSSLLTLDHMPVADQVFHLNYFDLLISKQ
jgi:hypothetical protein